MASNSSKPFNKFSSCQMRQCQLARAYTTKTMAGSAIPIKPLLRVARAIAHQQPNIQRLRRWGRSVCWASKKLQSAAAKNADSPVSSELKWPPTTHIGAEPKATAAKTPARGLYKRHAVKPTRRIVR